MKVCTEAEGKLQVVINSSWNRLAKELVGQDHHHYLRAYSPGKFLILLESCWGHSVAECFL